MASVLSGRMHALDDAHGLVLSGMKDNAPSKSKLGELVETILRPHDDHDGLPRITVDGPEVSCGERTVTAMSLVLHELATNAVKYGSLASDGGRVDIAWRSVGPNLYLTWIERGGEPIDGPPSRHGFGSKLVENTITQQLRGAVAYDWRRDGLEVQVEVPQASLAD
ncbi:MAG: sensor histidine kinase [Pseudaminobacter sp.]|nr:sensor histidine kinase [Pseudaminobacter sp.]